MAVNAHRDIIPSDKRPLQINPKQTQRIGAAYDDAKGY